MSDSDSNHEDSIRLKGPIEMNGKSKMSNSLIAAKGYDKALKDPIEIENPPHSFIEDKNQKNSTKFNPRVKILEEKKEAESWMNHLRSDSDQIENKSSLVIKKKASSSSRNSGSDDKSSDLHSSRRLKDNHEIHENSHKSQNIQNDQNDSDALRPRNRMLDIKEEDLSKLNQSSWREDSAIEEEQPDEEDDELSDCPELEGKSRQDVTQAFTKPLEEKKPDTVKLKIRNALDHWTTTIFFTLITVWVLFGDDIKMISTEKEADASFSIVVIVFMFFFLVEFILSCLVIEDYFLGFFFWLDLISLVSMILDVHWFYDIILDLISSGGSKAKSAASIAKAGRGARVGSRSIKILRILRIVRLVRIAKLYKAGTTLNDNSKNPNRVVSAKEVEISIPEESKVGKKLSDLTTKRVIILVLSMIIGVILFNASYYYDALNSMDFGMKLFNDFDDPNDPSFNLTFNIYVNEHRNISTPILYAQVFNLTYGDPDIEDNLRFDERIIAEDDCENFKKINNETRCYAVFDNRSSSRLTSILNIVKTFFICFALAGGSICFSKDTNEMVLEPIESMIDKIEKISRNPIDAMEENEKDDYLKTIVKEEEQKNKCCGGKAEKKKDAPLETVILEKTISKIGALLALGFGEAGSKIIADNMKKKANNTDGEVNPMLKGNKVMAIYGFCDIRNFTDTTEILQEHVMIFVNEIAEIVHEITSDYCGSANKNIGDAFLLVWKFDADQCIFENGHLVGLKDNKQVNEIVDCAVIAFIKILAKVHKSYKLDKYRKNPKLNERIQNYSVKMGFGLHLGWAIEGAIGSTFKIDASYLSPHVNLAGKLEEETKEYGAQLIISEAVYNHMSQNARKNLRIIDRVSLIENLDMSNSD